MGKIILGSSSPRRADILEKQKLDFEIIPSSYVEPHDQTDFSYAYVEDLAYNKALDVAKKISEEALVIGADTIVVLDNKVLGKPKNENDAKNMLKMLSGKSHKVLTGVCIKSTIDDEFVTTSSFVCCSKVYFKKLSQDEIEEYVLTKEPMDKAGAYAIQGLAGKFVEKINGSFHNIVGFPVSQIYNVLKEENLI